MAYARIEEGFWTDPKIRKLTLAGKIIGAWLFTNPHRHFSGIYYLPKVLVSAETGVPIDEVNKELEVLQKINYMHYSEDFSVVWVVTMLKHQTGGKELSSTQVTGIENHLRTLHRCPLIAKFIEKYQHLNISYNTPIDTPVDTPIDIKSQSKSQSKKEGSQPLPPDGGNGDERPRLVFSCPHFEMEQEYFDASCKISPAFPLKFSTGKSVKPPIG